MNHVDVDLGEQLASSPAPTAKRLLSAQRVLSVSAILGLTVPVAAYFWLVQHYSVNVVHSDQWSDVDVIRHAYSGHLTFGTLWTQHNQNRTFFPNLIVLLLWKTTHFNVVLEEYLSALLLCLAAAFLILAHRRRSPQRSWITSVPVAILMLSLVQADSALLGYQLSWYLVLFTLAVALFLLDRPLLTPFAFVLAIAAAVVGSYSAFHGLLIWIAGLVLLYHRSRPRRQVLMWCTAAIATVALYLYHFSTGIPSSFSGLHSPGAAMRFFLLAIGDVVGVKLSDTTGAINNAIFALGLIVVVIAIYSVLSRGLRRDDKTGAPIGVAVTCFGLLFAASIAYGRTWAGPVAASATRYTTFDLLILVGSYLTLLERPLERRTYKRPMLKVAPAVPAVLVCAICLQVVFGVIGGIRDARTTHRALVTNAVVLTAFDRVPDHIVQSALYPLASSPSLLRADAQILKKHRLALFATDGVNPYAQKAALYEKRGYFAYNAPSVTSVLRPLNGQTLRGGIFLDARVRDDVHAIKVEFHLRESGLQDVDLGAAAPTLAGWILRWNSMTVANGSYSLESVVYAPRGSVTRSAPIAIAVAN